MAELTGKQKAFFRQMADEGEEFERRGVDLLLKRNDYPVFFDAVREVGLFDASRNPTPVPAESEGYFRIPYWHILDYLKAVAKRAGETNDRALARKVLDVVANITHASEANTALNDNYHTANAFVEVLGSVPTAEVTMADIDLVSRWLGGHFDRALTGSSLAGRTFAQYIESEDPQDWKKACRLLRHATELSERAGRRDKQTDQQALIDDHWLKGLIEKHARNVGKKCREEAASLFVERLTQVYSDELDQTTSWLTRPAIEEHEQNHSWEGPANRFVEALREVLLGWLEANSGEAKGYVEGLLSNDAQIVRRLAIHIIDERYDLWQGALMPYLGSMLSDSGHIHEGYRLLRNRFSAFSHAEQDAVLAAIRDLPLPRGDNPELRLQRFKHRWLSAIAGQGNDAVDAVFTELGADEKVGEVPTNPDFFSYHTTHSGFGESPFKLEQLLDFARQGILVENLNAFAEPDQNFWRGPTIRGLTDMVEEGVAAEPALFLRLLPEFLNARRDYQYAVINGFKKQWDQVKQGEQPTLTWADAWPQLLTFFEAIISPPSFWEERSPETDAGNPTRAWIPGIMAEFLRAGLRNDKTAFATELLPQSWSVIRTLVQKAEEEGEAPDGDAMHRAINSPKGKAIEAMIDHALRVCRVSDASKGNHNDAWTEMKPLFDQEMAKCVGSNFEFSTLCGAYIANLRYLSLGWYEANFGAVFPLAHPSNCLAAIDGLAFAPATPYIYSSLVGAGVIDWALQQVRGRQARERLVERMALAFIWEQDNLGGPRFKYLFDSRCDEDLSGIASFYWSVRGQDLKPEHIERILQFWQHCIVSFQSRETQPAKLLSTLSLLSTFVKTIGAREQELLAAVAPYIPVSYHVDEFMEQLGRLAPENPTAVAAILGAVLRHHKPNYDYKDRLKNLLRFLAAQGATRPQALEYANELTSYLPGALELFRELTDTQPA